MWEHYYSETFRKTFRKLGREENCFNIMKKIYGKPRANIKPDDERLKAFILR